MNKVTYKTLRIGDIVQTVSFTHKFNKDKLIAINTSDVYDGTMGAGTLTPINELKGQFKKTIQKGDILFSEIRPANRRFAKVSISDCQDFVVSTKLMVLRIFNDKVDANYFFYCLTNQPFLDTLQRRAENRIGSFPQITFDILAGYTFPIPPLDEQKRIAKVIFNIDRKIELNKAINDNLEAMARQLYDYWFVQFDFPNEKGKPYKSSGGDMVWNEKLKREIPEGWNVANVFDELSVQYGFPFSTELFTEEPTSIPVVRIRDILENSVSAYSEEEVDEKYKLQKQDLLVGMDGNFHMNYWNDNVSYLNQRSVRLRAKSKSTVSIMQAKYDIAPYIKAKELRAKGSTVGHLSDKDLKELFVLVCPNIDFRNKFDSILAEIIENRCEMIELTKQRDELLPLLMNGQATVNYHLSSTPTTAFGMINKASTGIIGTAKFDMD